MLRIKAKIYLKTTEEGGLTKPGFSGMQPSFAVPNDLIMCRVYRSDGEQEMPLGTEYVVDIDLPYGENFHPYLVKGMPARLHIGQRVIAEGDIM